MIIIAVSGNYAYSEEVDDSPVPDIEVQSEQLVIDIPKIVIFPNIDVASEAVFAVNLDTQEIEYAKMNTRFVQLHQLQK